MKGKHKKDISDKQQEEPVLSASNGANQRCVQQESPQGDLPDHESAEAVSAVSEPESVPSASQEERVRTEEEVLKDRLLRLQADFDNYRKRTVKERNEVTARATEAIVSELLPAIDHMDMAIASANKHEVAEAFLQGFRLVSEQLQAALRKSGVVAVDAKRGDVFDPKKHEAVSAIASESLPADAVAEQVRRGYLLGDRLVRAPQVVVSSGRSHSIASDGQGTPTPVEKEKE